MKKFIRTFSTALNPTINHICNGFFKRIQTYKFILGGFDWLFICNSRVRCIYICIYADVMLNIKRNLYQSM